LKYAPTGAAANDPSIKQARLAKTPQPDPFRGTVEEGSLPSFESTIFIARHATNSSASADGILAEDFLPVVNFSSIGPVPLGLTTETEVWGANATFTLRIDGDDIVLDDMPFVKAVAHWEPGGLYDRCRDRGGAHTAGGKCWTFQKLASLCVQVEKDDSGVWKLAHRVPGQNETYGCTFSRGEWKATDYETEPLPSDFGEDTNYTNNNVANLAGLSIMVRSKHDPYFTALSVTEGSLKLPWSSSENIVLGIVMFVMGVGFGAQPWYLCWRWCTKGSKERREFRRRRNQLADNRCIGSEILSPSSRAARQGAAETIGMKAAHGHSSEEGNP